MAARPTTRRRAHPPRGAAAAATSSGPGRGPDGGRRPKGRPRAVSPTRRPPVMSRNAAILAVLLLAVAAVLAPFMRAWVEQQGRISALEADIEQHEKSVAELRVEDKRWDDPNYVITQARERFTYVMPGEVGYVVLDTPRTVADEKDPSSAAARQAAASNGSWVGTLWGSVEVAGQAPADPAGSTGDKAGGSADSTDKAPADGADK